MTYLIQGLEPDQFAGLFDLPEAALAARRARRVTADASHGFACRVSLCDADEGEALVLVNHVSHAVETPYRHAFAIYVRQAAREAARFVDQCPAVFEGRPMALRGFAADGMLHTARLALPGTADETIRAMLEDQAVAYIDAHNAAHGCFSARIVRHG